VAHLEVNTHQNISEEEEKKRPTMNWKENGACFKVNV
jgi:hypothetical protein